MMMWSSSLGRFAHQESPKFYFIFMTFIQISTNFGNLYEFLEYFNEFGNG
jgi:hypothetical protein